MSRYLEAKEMYAKIGIDTDKAINTLKSVPVALHCWQGDDVRGFDQKAEPPHPRSLWRILTPF